MSRSREAVSRKILIADDDEGSLALLSAWLGKKGYQVVSACDGEEALKKAAAQSPDLIFLDIMMPKMDGYSLLLWLKGDARTQHIPIFIISGQSERDHSEISRNFGAVEFIQKPYSVADVARKVERALA